MNVSVVILESLVLFWWSLARVVSLAKVGEITLFIKMCNCCTSDNIAYIHLPSLPNLRGGRNVKNQNVKGSERQKYFLNWSERQKWRGWSERWKSERQKSKKECRKSKMTFDVLIFFDAIGNIRMSKVSFVWFSNFEEVSTIYG